MSVARRELVRTATAASLLLPHISRAQTPPNKVIKIGVLTDMSGPYRDVIPAARDDDSADSQSRLDVIRYSCPDSLENRMAVSITQTDYDSAGLRQAAARSKDAAAARRMLAIAMVLEGRNRTEAAQTCGMDRQTLRDWVHRFNEEGLPGLSDRKAPGAKPRLSKEQQAELATIVRSGPDVAEHGVVRWRRVDLSKLIEDRFNVRLAERSVGAQLWRLGFRHMSVRPHNPTQNADAIETHKKTSPPSSRPPSRSMPKASRSSSGGKTKPASASKAR